MGQEGETQFCKWGLHALLIGAASIILAPLSSLAIAAEREGAGTFEFVAFGDMPYRTPGDFGRLENLIEDINREKPAFTVHVGDIKNGILNCSTDYYLTIREYFEKFENPLIYTPGDNDWADCDRILAGGYSSRERLAELRRLFFEEAQSMGLAPAPLERQGDHGEYPQVLENAAWNYGGVTFATVHMVGADNNLADDPEEFRQRNAANVAWIEHAFEAATAGDQAGIVLFFHADIFSRYAPRRSFAEAIDAIAKGAESFGRPVLLVNGDAHSFGIDQPVRRRDGEGTNRNITRVIVFGGDQMHAVRISVSPKTAGLFTITPLISDKK